jgi:hypothetical protein
LALATSSRVSSLPAPQQLLLLLLLLMLLFES